MTADVDKTPAICLICNASIGVSTRNKCQIFNYNVTSSEQPVANILSVILSQEVRKEVIHSEIICKKCYKLCNEVDELQVRLTEIKIELNNNYQRTLRKVRGGQEEESEIPPKVISVPANKETTGTPGKRPGKNPPPENGATAATQDETVLENDDPEEDEDERSEDGNLEMDDDEKDADYVPKYDHEDIDDKEKKTGDYKKRRIPKSKLNDAKCTNIIPQMIISRENQTYTCIVCSADEKVQGDAKKIISHIKEAHNICLYICNICGMEFLKRTEMSQHIDTHIENVKGEYECDVCQRVFTNVRLFRVHKRMHFPQKHHVCEECGKAFTSKNMLDDHMNVHTGARPYKCGECGKDFRSKYSHKAHEKTHVGKPRPYKCSYCSKTFTTESSVATHEKTHSTPRNFPCTICGKSFSSGRNLEVHCIIHTGLKAFVCRMCGKAFDLEAEIRDHEITHTAGERPYKCEFCGAIFGQKHNLASHKSATHNDKRYQCSECGKGYKRRRLLDYHIKAVHTGERPYKCQLCSATFIYSEHLKKHSRIHTGEKPYLCEICGKAFNCRDNRNAHRFVHSHKKPYECLVCGDSFMRKPELYKHIESQGHINDTIIVNRPFVTTDDGLIAQQEQESCSEMIIANQENQVLEEESSSPKINTCTEEVGHIITDGEGQFADGDQKSTEPRQQ